VSGSYADPVTIIAVTFRRLHLWLPPLLYMAVIFHFSSESNPLPELTTRVWDKALHLIEYGGLGLLICRALLGEGIAQARAMLLAVMVASAYAASDEWHQAFVPLRSSDVLDWVADTIGSMLGAAVLAVLAGWPKHLPKSTVDSGRKQRTP
jgi:VanZ family protein